MEAKLSFSENANNTTLVLVIQNGWKVSNQGNPYKRETHPAQVSTLFPMKNFWSVWEEAYGPHLVSTYACHEKALITVHAKSCSWSSVARETLDKHWKAVFCVQAAWHGWLLDSWTCIWDFPFGTRIQPKSRSLNQHSWMVPTSNSLAWFGSTWEPSPFSCSAETIWCNMSLCACIFDTHSVLGTFFPASSWFGLPSHRTQKRYEAVERKFVTSLWSIYMIVCLHHLHLPQNCLQCISKLCSTVNLLLWDCSRICKNLYTDMLITTHFGLRRVGHHH